MFRIKKTQGRARSGELSLQRGVIQTPCFMPIATKGAVKSLDVSDLKHLGAQMILSNTYHLLLRPGQEAMQRHGGMPSLMGWDGPMLTDSGGYQVFSLSKMNKTTDEGVTFASHINGRKIHLSPESSIAMQQAIGADVMMQFDDVAAGQAPRARVEEAMQRSLSWAQRCLIARTSNQKLFGIVQGGVYEDLRTTSANALTQMDFDGFAIGGLSVGEKREDTYRMSELVADLLPATKPRYFMGGGMPEEIVFYVNAGVDMFDCVLPTRNARHGTLFVWTGQPEHINWSMNPTDFYERLRVGNEMYQFDDSVIDAHCGCHTCKTVSRAYLRHLFATGELLAFRLASIHNLAFYMRLMSSLRAYIGSQSI